VTPPELNIARLRYDVTSRPDAGRYERFWETKQSHIPPEIFRDHPKVWLEVGAGTGWFFTELARRNADTMFVAVERERMRGRRLERKTSRANLPNLAGFRGNAIPALIHEIPAASVERIYILYPCPWPKMSQRRHRWYLHPIMPHLLRVLKKDGLIVWASDQKFYIDEAKYVCETFHNLETLVHGEIAVNPYNGLEHFPGGRTKFERTFLASGQPCYELISRNASGKEFLPVV
jgi:tRNA (guanine-N7-)-methyltransferase